MLVKMLSSRYESGSAVNALVALEVKGKPYYYYITMHTDIAQDYKKQVIPAVQSLIKLLEGVDKAAAANVLSNILSEPATTGGQGHI